MIYAYEKYKDAFYVDGSLRDIYVYDANMGDYDILLGFLRSQGFPMMVNGESLLAQTWNTHDIFRLFEGQTVTFTNGIMYAWHFFTPEEIEIDIDPRYITQDDTLHHLLDFLRTIADVLQKSIVLTDESNALGKPLFQYDPLSRTDTWYLSIDRDISEIHQY